MLRVGLIGYLMLMTLAGPAWCCCTFDRLTPHSGRSDSKSEPATPARTCCQHRSAPEGKKSSDTSKHQNSDNRNDSCPCKDQRPNQAAVVSQDVQGSTQLRVNSQIVEFGSMPADSVDLLDDQTADCNTSLNNHSAFRLSGPALLCALQVFRC